MKALAMILAGGEGRRLSILSQKRAKPAVPFAGKYRIIDFVLSNCCNSGIYTVGICTQYRPRSLNDHIRTGAPWDMDRMSGGVTLLQPYLGRSDSDWYSGTADAIQQNFDFVRHYDPELVLVLGGDHIYKMNYDKLVDFHTDHQADLTVAARQVPLEEASRMGILEVDQDQRVISFEEKPIEPKGSLASMGTYVFSTEALSAVLREDAVRKDSTHDFGKNIMPVMIDRYRVYAYPFSDYWVDVGTVQAYWETHMDLLADTPPLDLNDREWVIHTRSEERPPANLRTGATVLHSLISDGCCIEGTVEYSVLSPGVRVERGAVVRYSIVMTDSTIEQAAVVDRSILDKKVVVGSGAQLGHGTDYSPNRLADLNSGISLVGKSAAIPPGMRVGRNCVIASEVAADDFGGTSVPSGTIVDPSRGAASGGEIA
ncbi:MAG: glucose-1-phosphate adenylyltransferase [Thermoflexales bacterium]|nr:glucose-1-phosphate adenylyltransferase [Thermoflexales bacterium]